MSENVVIMGSGPAGLTAAIYCSREDFKPLVITGVQVGGQLELTGKVENYPAFPDGINGPELMERMKLHAENFGTRFKQDYVQKIDLSEYPYKVITGSEEIETKAMIIATGASAKWLGIPSEKEFIGRGVSSCATCDAPFYKDMDVIVVGGGDTAMEDSLFLTKFVRSVTIVHRRNAFKASRIMQERIMVNPKINILWDSEIVEIKGGSTVESVKIINNTTGKMQVINTQGIFVAIGHKPNSEFLQDVLPLDQNGYVQSTDEVFTNIGGVFVAGDLVDQKYRQAITAASSGCKAALEVRSYLLNLTRITSGKQRTG